MSRITWDAIGSRKYEVGVDHGVLYQDVGEEFTNGVPWNGLSGVDGDDDAGGSTPLYSGDVKVDTISTYAEYSGTITAYTYPDEFEVCMGSVEVIPGIFTRQQSTQRFGLSYRTLIGSDVKGTELGYKIHLIYDAEVTSISRSAASLNDSGEGEELSWDFECLPMLHDDYNPYSEIIIDSTKLKPEYLAQLEDIIYGTDEEPARLPALEELIELFYEPEPIPPEWDGYPYEQTYPAIDQYPIEPNPPTFTESFRVYAGELLPTYGEYAIDNAGLDDHGHRLTFIPEDATILGTDITGIPEEYSNLTYSTSMSANRSYLYFSYVNNTEETITIAESFSVTVVYIYNVYGG